MARSYYIVPIDHIEEAYKTVQDALIDMKRDQYAQGKQEILRDMKNYPKVEMTEDEVRMLIFGKIQ